MSSFAGNVVLITGATSGVGRATSVAFAREGASLVLTGRRVAEGRQTVELVRRAGRDGRFLAADVTVEDDARRVVAAAVDSYGRLGAFNDAGYLSLPSPTRRLPTWRRRWR